MPVICFVDFVGWFGYFGVTVLEGAALLTRCLGRWFGWFGDTMFGGAGGADVRSGGGGGRAGWRGVR